MKINNALHTSDVWFEIFETKIFAAKLFHNYVPKFLPERSILINLRDNVYASTMLFMLIYTICHVNAFKSFFLDE